MRIERGGRAGRRGRTAAARTRESRFKAFCCTRGDRQPYRRESPYTVAQKKEEHEEGGRRGAGGEGSNEAKEAEEDEEEEEEEDGSAPSRGASDAPLQTAEGRKGPHMGEHSGRRWMNEKKKSHPPWHARRRDGRATTGRQGTGPGSAETPRPSRFC